MRAYECDEYIRMELGENAGEGELWILELTYPLISLHALINEDYES